MSFVPKKTRQKVEAGCKTIYLRRDLIDKVDRIARENSTSFNNVVVSMIEKCLEDDGEETRQRPLFSSIRQKFDYLSKYLLTKWPY